MRYSKLFTKTAKEIPADETAVNAQLLIRGGFIHKVMAGVYEYLPLGLRVLNKIVSIIRDEMNAIGGQELSLTALQNPEVWKITGRWDDKALDVWFKTQLKSGGELGLASTHEDPLTEMMKHHISSYKDLPRFVYQFQVKFRNELRAKSGILRGREFLMKDLYSFTRSQKELDEFYENVKKSYINIFGKMGLADYLYYTFASGGAFSNFSHEFQIIHSVGEDTIYVDEKNKFAINKEVYNEEVLKELGVKENALVEKRGIEVGNIFKLGTRFSEPLGLTFVDENGDKKPVIMGSYGIGPGRVMGTIVEIFNDKKGIVWPESVAPFSVYLIDLTDGKRGAALYADLENAGVEILYDDRQGKTPGEKFADADLLGIPYRVLISEKTSARVEVKKRNANETRLMAPAEFLNRLADANL